MSGSVVLGVQAMHEWALAEAVIVGIMKEAEQHGISRVAKATIKIGELQQIDLEIFRFALEVYRESSGADLPGDALVIEIEKSSLRCRVCGKDWGFDDGAASLKADESEAIHFLPEVAHTYMRCPHCGSPDFEITKGRGVWIERIEGEG